MFDVITCDYNLPHSNISDNLEFQTKSFDSVSDKYRIDLFGQLYKIGKKPNYLEFFPYSGTVNICTIYGGYYFEYDIEFFEGRIEGAIELIEKRNMKKGIEEIKKMQIAWANGELEN